jgi:hypothetical protein
MMEPLCDGDLLTAYVVRPSAETPLWQVIVRHNGHHVRTYAVRPPARDGLLHDLLDQAIRFGAMFRFDEFDTRVAANERNERDVSEAARARLATRDGGGQ